MTNNEDSFVCKVAKTVADAKQLIEQGFGFVATMESIKLYPSM